MLIPHPNHGTGHSRKNRGSLVFQVRETLECLYRPGSSRHEAKALALGARQSFADRFIFSSSTLGLYIRFGADFVKWVKKRHPDVRLLEDCKKHVDEYLEYLKETPSQYGRARSVSTLKTVRSALAKLFGVTATDAFTDVGTRCRADIFRSRTASEKTKKAFDRDSDETLFTTATGVRRREKRPVYASQILELDGVHFLTGIKGKGGRVRNAPIICRDDDLQNILKYAESRGEEPLFPNMHSDFHGHSLRALYACILYLLVERPPDTLPRKEKYYCRADMQGIVFDRRALRIVSLALGHNRIKIFPASYAYKLDEARRILSEPGWEGAHARARKAGHILLTGADKRL